MDDRGVDTTRIHQANGLLSGERRDLPMRQDCSEGRCPEMWIWASTICIAYSPLVACRPRQERSRRAGFGVRLGAAVLHGAMGVCAPAPLVCFTPGRVRISEHINKQQADELHHPTRLLS